MIRKITAHKKLAIGSLAVLGVVVIALVLPLAFRNNTGPGLPEPLPPMTLIYEVNGPSISVGNRSVPDFKETMRLEYRSQTDWKETVIESPVVDLGRYGEASNVGSYRMVKGNVETDYDAMTDTTGTSSLDEGIHIPRGTFGMVYTPVGHSPIGTEAGVAVVTDARVCFNGDCVDNAAGVKYTNGDRELVMYEGNGFIIPVKDGDGFVLKSAEIHVIGP